jgi:uncharacterized SAM-binding protein YcdF (DUF218 family)
MQGLLTLLPKQKSHGAELAILLGRGPESQAELALTASTLWSSNQELSFFVSGMTDAPEIIDLMTEMGVPETQIGGERCSQSTWENGLFSELLINSDKTKNILLVTDSYHMPRAFLVFQGFGFNVQPYPIKVNQGSLNFFAKSKTVLREYAALVSYGLSGKFRPKPLDQKNTSKAEASKKVKDWGCQIN